MLIDEASILSAASNSIIAVRDIQRRDGQSAIDATVDAGGITLEGLQIGFQTGHPNRLLLRISIPIANQLISTESAALAIYRLMARINRETFQVKATSARFGDGTVGITLATELLCAADSLEQLRSLLQSAASLLAVSTVKLQSELSRM